MNGAEVPDSSVFTRDDFDRIRRGLTGEQWAELANYYLGYVAQMLTKGRTPQSEFDFWRDEIILCHWKWGPDFAWSQAREAAVTIWRRIVEEKLEALARQIARRGLTPDAWVGADKWTRDEATKHLALTGQKLGHDDSVRKCIAAARALGITVITRQANAAYKSLTPDLKRSRGERWTKPHAQ